MEAATTFEYGNDEGHWDGAKLLQQIFDRALPIAEALYPGYELLFLFDNATSHSTYAEDALRTNKNVKGDLLGTATRTSEIGLTVALASTQAKNYVNSEQH